MQTRKLSKWTWVMMLSLTFLLTACGLLDSPTPTTEVEPTVPTIVVTDPAVTPTTVSGTAVGTEVASQGQAFIESVQVAVLESFPVQVNVTVNGNLSDGCTSLAGINVQQQGATFVLDVQTNYNNQAACTQALVPFSETVALNVQGLAAGTYTVVADGVSETFTLSVDNEPQPTPDLGSASMMVDTASAQPGEVVTLTGQGFSPGTKVDIGIGPTNSEYDIIATTETDQNGSFVTDVAVPDYASVGEEWVFVADLGVPKVTANPILIVDSGAGGVTPPEEDGVNEPVNGMFTRTYMYLIALEDAGQSGMQIGCNDSVIPVIIEIEPTIAPMTAAINQLLSLNDQYYGQSGLYNALYQSDLTLEGINIVNGEAIINLSGALQLAGACDNPRILAQLEQTALQYSTVSSVTINLNGQPLEDQLSGQ